MVIVSRVVLSHADIFLTCGEPNAPIYQIWLNKKQQGYELAVEIKGIPGSGQVSFGDMDADGTMDMVFPVCRHGACVIHVVYNQQIGICIDSLSRKCRDKNSMCSSDPEFKFDFDEKSPVYENLYRIIKPLIFMDFMALS